MVRQPDLIAPEIAAHYDVALTTVQRSWTQHPDWPEATGRRGKWKTYPADAVAAWVQEHRAPEELPVGNPDDLLTVKQVAEYIGRAESTVRADISRNRIKREPDVIRDGVKYWRRSTIDAARSGVRAYGR